MVEITRGATIYIIKQIYTSCDGCNGYDKDEYFTNWIFSSEEKASAKCSELNKELGGRYNSGFFLKYKVVKDYILN